MSASSSAFMRAIWGLASWLLPLVAVFLLTPSLLRLLGPERFGVLMIVLVTPAIAGQLDFGLALSAVRQFATEHSSGLISGPRTLFSYLLAFCAIALLFGAGVAASSQFLADSLGFSALLGSKAARELIQWCAVWGVITLLTAMPAVVARATQSLAWLTAVQTLTTITLWVGAFLLISNGHSIRDVILLGIFVSVTTAALLGVFMRQEVRWHGPLSLQMPARNLGFAMGMFASQIAGAIAFQVDRILISSFGSPIIAGAYVLCANVANKPLAAVVALTSFAFPQATGMHEAGERDNLVRLLHALDSGVALLVIPLLIPIVWLAEPFMKLWVGNYSTPELVWTFRVLLVAFAIPAFAVPVGHVLAASGRSGPAARFSWLTASVIVVGIVVLVPLYGLLGAATAILCGMSTSLIFSIVARRALALPMQRRRRLFWPGILLGGAAQTVSIFLLTRFVTDWWSVIVVGATSWVAFFLTRAIFGLLSSEESRLLSRLLEIVFPTHQKR